MVAPASNAVTGKLPGMPPTPARDAAKTFRVLDGFRMDLLAAEPLVASPVAMTYDENGRAFVCEMRDYPFTDKANHKPGQENPTDQSIGRIRLLEDTDGDGVFDKATVFAEGLSWPTGVACWKGGVFVAATPDIWYLKDTDGDGKADLRQRIFTGFRKLNVQAVMNNLVWALDNHLHGAGGSNGGEIRPGDKPDAKPLKMTRNDFRFNPVTGEMELLSGGARFGGTFDDWGSRFLCNIRNPAQHIVLPRRYLARNPYLAARSPLNDMAASGDQLPIYSISQPEPWRVIRAKRWAGERDINMPRSELVGAGVVTSSSGVTSYRGAAYPEKYHGNVFVTECASNLLYRLQLTADGVTFKAARVDGKAEMVASTDNWFRPVNFVNAPDGTLHVMDMYRENIEHPWSIPDDILAAVDLESGRDMGRIWRLTPPGFKAPKPPRLGRASSAELVATLENPNAWWRETAQRLLFERRHKSVVPALHDLVKNGQRPQARLHALWALDGLNALGDDDLLASLNDKTAGVRENAVKLAESRAKNPAIANAIFPLAADPDARVRFQTAFTLGELSDPRAQEALATIAKRDATDPWIRTAVLSSVAHTSDQLLARLLADAKFVSSSAATGLVRELAQIVGVRGKKEEIQRVLASAGGGDLASPALREIISGIGEGLKRSGKSLRRAGLTGEASRVIDAVLAEATQTAADSKSASVTRLAAIHLLAFDDFERVKAPLARLLAPSEPQDVQRAAVAALGSFNARETAPLLLANWNTQTPAVRAEVVDAMLGSQVRVLPLMQAVARGEIPSNQIPFARRRLLLRNNDAEVKALAAKFFGDTAPGPRKSTIESYQPALALKGDPARGRKLFEAACIACHRASDLGVSELGPNLATIRAWNPEQVLVGILDPNREVAPNYIGYTIETKDGRSIFGIIAEENAASVTLKCADGSTQSVLRRDIAKLTGSGQSLMPEGLEAAISKESMADLIAFLLPSSDVSESAR
ncbi:MAG: PVC-type heme-binding CxxCH protein [Opitutaceae bacterium]